MEINQQISKSLSDAFDRCIALIKPLSQAELQQKPDAHSWSVGQIVDHILICSSDIPDRSIQATSRAYDERVPVIEQIFLDLDAKYEADQSLLPQQEYYEKEELLQRLLDCKTNLIVCHKDKDLMPLCKGMEFPQLGYLTRFEWLSFIAVHIQRHCYQIERVLEQIETEPSQEV